MKTPSPSRLNRATKVVTGMRERYIQGLTLSDHSCRFSQLFHPRTERIPPWEACQYSTGHLPLNWNQGMYQARSNSNSNSSSPVQCRDFAFCWSLGKCCNSKLLCRGQTLQAALSQEQLPACKMKGTWQTARLKLLLVLLSVKVLCEFVIGSLARPLWGLIKP